MDIQTVAQLIGTLGFPIVCAVILSYIVKFMFEKYTTDIKELTKTHKEESDKFAEALNNNTAQRMMDVGVRKSGVHLLRSE